MTTSALLVWGGWTGHEPERCVELIARELEDAGLRVGVSDTLASFEDADALRTLDVIVPCWTMGRLTETQERGLLDAVRSGTGLAGWHGGMGDAFRESTEYQFAVGGQFVAHPGDAIDYRVRITRPDHVIVRGLDDFDVHSEQYYLHVDPSNLVLAETEFTGGSAPWIDGCRMPVAWTRSYGRGRVFYCSIGHGVDELRIPEVQTMITRGIRWTAGETIEVSP